MPIMSSGRFFAQTLEGYGVTHVFAVPAIFHSAMAAMEDTGIRRVTTHHEIAAAYMADGYARAARRPGICMGQSVGAANLAAGLRDAFLASSPVIAISGGPRPESRYRYLYQVIDDFPMFEPVTKFNAMVEKPERLADLLRQAFRVATTGSPGPVHLELPGRLGEGVAGEAEFEVVVEERFTRIPAYRPAPEPEQVRDALAALGQAQRPVIVAGGGASIAGAGPELVKLAEMLSVPVAVSLNGKDTIADGHPLCVGLVGSYGRACANQVVQEADLVLFVGSRAGGLTTSNWNVPGPRAAVVQLDIEPAELGRNYPLRVGVLGDAKVALQRMIEAARPAPPRHDWLRHARDLVDRWRAEVEPMAASDAVPIRPERICKEITEALPAGAVLVADTGHAAIWTGTMVGLNRPGQRYIRCAGTLGWAFPGSLGVKCALPDKPVLCFTGDGGMYYHLSELETAARMGINTVVLVNNNGALQQVKRGIDAAYGGTQRGRAHEMWVFREGMNFARIAEDMGCLGIRVEKPNEIRPALERAFAAGRPTVIDVVSDIGAAPAWA